MGHISHGRPCFSRTRRPERLSPRAQLSSCPGLELTCSVLGVPAAAPNPALQDGLNLLSDLLEARPHVTVTSAWTRTRTRTLPSNRRARLATGYSRVPGLWFPVGGGSPLEGPFFLQPGRPASFFPIWVFLPDTPGHSRPDFSCFIYAPPVQQHGCGSEQ